MTMDCQDRGWRGVRGLGTALLLLCTGLACGGVFGADGGTGAVQPPPETTAPVVTEPSAPPEKKMFSYGKPDGWTVQKDEFAAKGHQVIRYTLSGRSASVQLVLHPPGAEPPSATQEMASFKAALSEEEDVTITFGELEARTRSLSGQEVVGSVLPLAVDFGDGVAVQRGEHGDWLVRGPKTSCLVVVDVPDVTQSAEVRAVDEVLTRLVVP